MNATTFNRFLAAMSPIVFPTRNRLIRDPKNQSHLNMRHSAINACQSKMIAKRSRIGRCALL